MSALSDLLRLDIASARKGLADKQFTARELTEAYLAAADDARALNGFITETPEQALADADAADARLLAGNCRLRSPACPSRRRTCSAQRASGQRRPPRFLAISRQPYESTVSGKLKADGAVLLGKANLDEFAMGSANITSAFGPVTNPWTPEGAAAPLTPGGSSGGSAALVAAGAAIAATGTDTGGSIRQPAALCGVVGLKPTYGRCSRWGVVAFASSLDQPGPITRSVRDAAIMLGSMAGHDPKDSTSASAAPV